MKKLLISLGTIGAITTPIFFVVACWNSSESLSQIGSKFFVSFDGKNIESKLTNSQFKKLAFENANFLNADDLVKIKATELNVIADIESFYNQYKSRISISSTKLVDSDSITFTITGQDPENSINMTKKLSNITFVNIF